MELKRVPDCAVLAHILPLARAYARRALTALAAPTQLTCPFRAVQGSILPVEEHLVSTVQLA